MARERDFEGLSPEGVAVVESADRFLEESIREGRPLEALAAIRHLGEISGRRAKEAARAATEGPWSWSDVGGALGTSKQAAHQKLSARVRHEIDKSLAQLDRAEEKAHAKIARRAQKGRRGLDRAAPFAPDIDSARERLDGWERGRHDKVDRKIREAREKISRTEQDVQRKIARKVDIQET